MKKLDWAAIGAIVAILTAVITWLAWQHPKPVSGSSPQPSDSSAASPSSGGRINGSLKNAVSSSCLDDTNLSTSAGTQMQIWQCSGNPNQSWTTHSDGTISNRYSKLCLAVQGNASYDLTAAIQQVCDSKDPGDRMRLVWTTFSDQSVGYEIVNDHEMCLDDKYASTSDGNPVDWFQCNGTRAQEWYPG